MFGDTEIVGRLFSWIACLISVIILFNFSQNKYKNNSILLAALISSNLIFMHYSNEVRSSALCLLFSSILISSFLQNKNNPSNNFYLGSIILSLTNYLGLIYSITILSYAYLISQKKKKLIIKTIFSILIISIWPLIHINYGSILEKTGKNDIRIVNNFFDTFEIAGNVFFHHFYRIPNWIIGTLVILITCFVIIYFFIQKKNNVDKIFVDSERLNDSFHLSILTLAFITLVAIIDLWTPISNRKSYIVLLPNFAIIIISIYMIFNNYLPKFNFIFKLFLIIFCSVNLTAGYRSLMVKNLPYDNFSNTAKIANNLSNDYHIYIYEDGNYWRQKVAEFYIAKYKPNVNYKKINNDNFNILTPAIIIFGSLSDKSFNDLKNNLNGFSFELIEQNYSFRKHTGGYIVKKISY